MELQKFFDDNKDNLINKLKEYNLIYHKYSNLGLIIIKTKKDFKYDYDMNPWLQYCRGVIIDSDKNHIVNLPPSNSIKIELDHLDQYENLKYENLIEGTMINMFYHNNEWMISTRSNIGCNNKWDKCKFNEMFYEISKDKLDYNELNKDHCYTFVLQHKKNKIISPIYENRIVLVNEINMKTFENIELSNLSNIDNTDRLSFDFLKNYNENLYYTIKGFTIKDGNKRYKWINPNYEYVLKLKPNHNKKILNYVDLRQNGNLKEYLKFFPEDRYEFNKYSKIYYELTKIIYDQYISFFVKKEIEKKDIKYSLKPILYEIHSYYKKTGIKINMKLIKEYLHNMEGKRILFIINYFKFD